MRKQEFVDYQTEIVESAQRLKKLVAEVMTKSSNVLMKRKESTTSERNPQVIANLGTLAHSITNEYNVLCESIRGALLICTNAEVFPRWFLQFPLIQ